MNRVVISSFDNPGSRHYAGGGSAVVALMAGWLGRDYQVMVVTAGRRRGTAVHGGVRYRYLPVAWAGPRAGQLLFHALLPFAARRIPHDLWIESFTPPFSTSFVPLFSPGPVVGFAQNLSGREMSHRYKLPFFLIERLGLRYYRDVVVLNPADAQTVRRCNPSATVRVIPNSVDLPQLDERESGQRRAHPVPGPRPGLGKGPGPSAGRLRPERRRPAVGDRWRGPEARGETAHRAARRGRPRRPVGGPGHRRAQGRPAPQQRRRW